MSERDHQIDAAWKAASVEAPPSALDDAIRAAARREVGAGPRRSRTPRWFPLAAAATVAALAIGVVQLAPRDQVTSATHISTAPVPEFPAAPAPSPVQSAAEPEKSQPTRENASPAPVVATARNAGSAQFQADAKPAPAAAVRDEPKLKTEDASRRRVEPQDKAEAGSSSDRLARADEASRAASAVETRKYAAAPAAAAPSAPMSPPAPPPMTPAAPPPPPQAPSVAGAPPRAFPASPANVQALQDNLDAARSAANAPARSFGALESNPAQAGAARQDAKVAVAKDASARSVDEWVALIRRLRADGKIADAAKELAAFHDMYKDRAEGLLPADLRQNR